MTRSYLSHRRAPRLFLAAPALVALALVAAGCGDGGDATAGTPLHSATDPGAPAGPDASNAADASAARASTDAGGPASTVVASGSGTTDATTSGSGTGGSTADPAPASTASAGSRTTVPPPSTARSTTSASTATIVTTATTATTAPPAGRQLAGTVTASPSCPVERAEQPCPPRPVAAAHIEAFDRAENLVTSTNADSSGRFTLTLAPGRYVLTASSGSVFPTCPPLTVEVPAGGDTRADILCDSGIR